MPFDYPAYQAFHAASCSFADAVAQIETRLEDTPAGARRRLNDWLCRGALRAWRLRNYNPPFEKAAPLRPTELSPEDWQRDRDDRWPCGRFRHAMETGCERVRSMGEPVTYWLMIKKSDLAALIDAERRASEPPADMGVQAKTLGRSPAAYWLPIAVRVGAWLERFGPPEKQAVLEAFIKDEAKALGVRPLPSKSSCRTYAKGFLEDFQRYRSSPRHQ